MIDLRGAAVFPGWIDAHGDLEAFGRALRAGLPVSGGGVSLDAEAERDSAVATAARQMLAHGWTQLHDAAGSWEDVERLRRLYAAGVLKLRVTKAIRAPGLDADSLLQLGPLGPEFDGRLWVRTIDLVLDPPEPAGQGSRGPRAGEQQSDTAAFRSILTEALRRGVQVRLHAASDSAIRLALELVRRTQRSHRLPDRDRFYRRRWRIEGPAVLDSALAFQFRVREVIPSVQPLRGVRDLALEDEVPGPLAGRLHPWRTLVDLGIPVAGGSGIPSASPSASLAYLAAVARCDSAEAGRCPAGKRTGQALGRDQALDLFTRSAAWAGFRDQQAGEIRPGRWADLTVFDRDLLDVAVADIPSARPVLTIVAGEVVHDAMSRR